MGKDKKKSDSPELRRRAERQIITEPADSDEIAGMSTKDMAKAIHELRVYQIELKMQNEELRRIQEELEEARDRYSHLYDFAPVGYLTVNEKGIVEGANLTFATLMGIERSAVVGKPFNHFIQREDQDFCYLNLQRLLESGALQSFKLRLVKNDGSDLYTNLACLIIRESDSAPKQIRIAVNDITEQMRAENALRTSEERLKLAQDIAKIGYWSWDIASGHAEWSDQVYDIFKAPRNRPSYEFAKSFVHPNDLNLWHDVIQQAVEKQQPFKIDYRAIRSDGKTIWAHNEAKTVFNEKAGFTGYQGIVQDITDRKSAEEALKESEERLRLLLAGSGVSFWEWFPEKGCIYFDDLSARIMCLTPGEKFFNFQSWVESIHPDSKPAFEKALNNYLEGRTPRYELEYRIRTKTGAWKWIWTAGECVEWDNNEKPVRFLGTYKDITERKWAEEILRKYNEQLELEVRNRTAEIEKQCNQLEEMNLFIKQASHKTIKAMEDDRKALSKEIHDSIGGSLAAIKMLLENRLKTSSQQPNGAIMSLQKIIGHLDDTIEESRRISYQLRPLALDDFDLTASLSEYIPGSGLKIEKAILTDSCKQSF